MAKFVPFIIRSEDDSPVSVKITRMKKSDAAQTEKEPVWQTSWMSDYIYELSGEAAMNVFITYLK